jgi:hypothetical protein
VAPAFRLREAAVGWSAPADCASGHRRSEHGWSHPQRARRGEHHDPLTVRFGRAVSR